MADPKQVQIRNMDPDIWAALRIEALSRQIPIGALMVTICRDWLDARFAQKDATAPR